MQEEEKNLYLFIWAFKKLFTKVKIYIIEWYY